MYGNAIFDFAGADFARDRMREKKIFLLCCVFGNL